MDSNLDIWAVQEDATEVFIALEQIKSGLSIIYDHVKCKINIGSNKITTRLFDTILYNEDSDTLIMIMQGSKATKDDMINYLSEKDLKYVEVSFLDNDIDFDVTEESAENKVPELWFARDLYVVKDAIDSSVDRGVFQASLMPLVTGNLVLSYNDNYGEPNSIDGRLFKGVVACPDKLILLVNQKDESKNIDVADIESILNANDFIYSIDYAMDIDLSCYKKVKMR